MAGFEMSRRLEDLLAYAEARAFDADHDEAAATFAVAADLAEEEDRPDVARYARTNARRSLVTAWARRRWPDEDIGRGMATVLARTSTNDPSWLGRSDAERTRFVVFRPRAGRFTFVSVSRRGRVSVTRER